MRYIFMDNLAFRCIKCGTVNVFKKKHSDGNSCMNCRGHLEYIGEAITSNGPCRTMRMTVNVDTTEIDKAMQKTEVLYKQISEVQAKLSNPYLVQEYKVAEEQPEIIKKFHKDVIDALRYGAEVLAKSR